MTGVVLHGFGGCWPDAAVAEEERCGWREIHRQGQEVGYVDHDDLEDAPIDLQPKDQRAAAAAAGIRR